MIMRQVFYDHLPRERHLSMLSCCFGSPTQGCLSWIPDFSKLIQAPNFHPFHKQYQAAGDSVAATKVFGVENHVMMLRARFVGEVEEVEPELELARNG
jgi:hypothetical protein